MIKAKCLAIDCRLAPENPFPCAIDDSVKAYKSLLKQGIDPKKIVFAGDLAGGGIIGTNKKSSATTPRKIQEEILCKLAPVYVHLI
jgi:hypothetical protein